MNSIFNIHNNRSRQNRLRNYYRFHSRIYDRTRWAFLFGRHSLVDMISQILEPSSILEIGCGTGYMLQRLHQQFPTAQITGVDVSGDMLSVAQQKLSDVKNVSLKQHEYNIDNPINGSYDLILLSYSLTMMDSHSQKDIVQLARNLSSDGVIAVVDFHSTPVSWFKQWMHLNHVNLSGDILPILQSSFTPIKTQTNPAYLGLWNYFQFLGTKR